MRLLPSHLRLLATGIFVVSLSSASRAGDVLHWNVGGDGNWSAGPADRNWNAALGGDPASNSAWPDTAGHTATFDDNVGGTVTVFGTVQTSGIQQNGAAYALEGGSILLVPDGSAGPLIGVGSNSTLTIGATLEGGFGLTKTGAGNLILNGQNTYGGSTAVLGGTLTLGRDNILSDSSLSLQSGTTLALGATSQTAANFTATGATLSGTGVLTSANYTLDGGTVVTGNLGAGQLNITGFASFEGGTSASQVVSITANTLSLSGDNLSDTALVKVGSGTSLLLNGNDTVGSVISYGGSIIGNGTLNAATYQLNGNTTMSGHLGDGAITTSGIVSFNGSSAGASLKVNDGVLNFSGTTAGSTVDVNFGSGLSDSGNLSDTATVTNAGFFNAQSSDTVGAYISNGGSLAGDGSLTAATYQLNNNSTVSGNLGAGVLSTTGQVRITGTAGAGQVSVGAGRLTLSGNNLSDSAAVSVLTGGELLVGGNEAIASLTSNGRILGDGTLTAGTYALNNGAVISGHLGTGTLTSSGSVSITGSADAGQISVLDGELKIAGGRLASNADVTLSSQATLNATSPVNIATLTSNGGTIAGTVSVGTETATLNDGSSVTGGLSAMVLTTHGTVSLSGSAAAPDIRIADGVLINTGIVGASNSHIDIAGGATLADSGAHIYSLLTTSGSGAGIWRGDLTNYGTVAPGGESGFGTLHVAGNFTNDPQGFTSINAGANAHDLLSVSGGATLGGVLDLHALDGQIAAMTPVQIIVAGAYTGNFDSLTEDLDGAVFFNASNGTITRLGANVDVFSGVNASQASTFAALYDDVIDPGVVNVTRAPLPERYDLGSGLASTNAPDLLNALSASMNDGSLDRAVLNRLSPAVYIALSDYAAQSVRTHRRTAMDAPALAQGTTAPAEAPPTHSKDSKGLSVAPPPAHTNTWEVFAAADYFDVNSSRSVNQADYGLSGAGVVAGARVTLGDRLKLAGYLAADDGRIRGSLINGDGNGAAFGVIGKYTLLPAYDLKLTGSASYGTFTFDGIRSSIAAPTSSAARFAPSSATFSDVDADATDFYLGVDAVAWKSGRFRLIPSLALDYTSASSDGFREVGPSANGSLARLGVDRIHKDSFISEMSLAAEADVTHSLTLGAQAGYDWDLRSDQDHVTARFVNGERPMTVQATPLNDELLFLGLGATWRATDSLSVRLNYRAEFREGADALNCVSLSTTFGF